MWSNAGGAAAVAALVGVGSASAEEPFARVKAAPAPRRAAPAAAEEPPAPPAAFAPDRPSLSNATGRVPAGAVMVELGTNLSVLTGDLTWSTESERLVMCDARDFQVLGLGLDDLIDAFVQSCLAVTAIDEQAQAIIDAVSAAAADEVEFYAALLMSC